jgi:hypothetical protein
MTRRLPNRCVPLTCWIALALFAPTARGGEDFTLFKFKRQLLTDVYFSEGANAGDLNRDGHPDVVYGPYWFEGPRFTVKHELYPPKPQNREGYADNFFNWIYDFNGDGWNDVFVVGFPGRPAYVYENPKGGFDKHWPKHQVFDSVGNESPHFTNLVGDERPELVCTFQGAFGFATIDWKAPLAKWQFHVISKRAAPKQFGHGLGVGDVDGDGRATSSSPTAGSSSPRRLPRTRAGRFTRRVSATRTAARRCTPTTWTATATTTSSPAWPPMIMAWRGTSRIGAGRSWCSAST